MIANHTEPYFLAGGGEMGELIRAKDWSQTPLGAPHKWPLSLRTIASVMLENPFGMGIAWGKSYTLLYNDTYRLMLGSHKHPQALGMGSAEIFSEMWHVIGPLFDDVMGGKAVGHSDFMVPMNRNGYIEECYFDFSYTPIRKENGEVGGILITTLETTGKKKSEQELKESEERFRMLADNIPNLAWMANADGWIYWYNKKWYDYTGTTPEQMEGWGWQSVHDANELPLVLEKWKRSIAYAEPFEMVFPLKGANGTFRQFLTRVLPLKNSQGEVFQWFGTNTDITEQKENEQALKESEERFRTMAESTSILIATSDETSNATYFNKAWAKLTGRPVKELMDFGWADLIHAEDRERFVNTYLSAFERRQPWESEFRILNKEGQYRWLLAKGPVRFRRDGTFAGYISSSIDITESKLANDIVRESEKRFRSLAESIPQLVWETDEKGNALFTSKKWEEYTGIVPKGEAEWRAMIHPDDFETNSKTWMHSLETGELYKCDVRIKSKQGEYRWHTVIGEPVVGPDNRIVKWIGAFTDIHTEKVFAHELEIQVESRTNALEKANQALALKNNELEKANKELQSFAYISSHDLQEPLRKIQTFSTQIMEKEFPNLTEKGKERFQRMQNAAQRMQTLINDLLTYSRTNAVERRFELIQLRDIVAEVKGELKEELLQKNAVLEVTETCELRVIYFQFKQLLHNLISNSLKFSTIQRPPHIRINGHLTTSADILPEILTRDIRYVHIRFNDNGIGFEQQYGERIFEVFQRLHGRDEYQGTGIGLAIVKKIVENHNGMVTASGEINVGATFDIYLPE